MAGPCNRTEYAPSRRHFHCLAGILLLGCVFAGCVSGPQRPRITPEVLAEYRPGMSYDKFCRRFHLREDAFEPMIDLPAGQVRGWYRVPEGEVVVSAIQDTDGEWIFDRQPWLMPGTSMEEEPSAGRRDSSAMDSWATNPANPERKRRRKPPANEPR